MKEPIEPVETVRARCGNGLVKHERLLLLSPQTREEECRTDKEQLNQMYFVVDKLLHFKDIYF